MLTPEQLADLRAKAEAATPGPWFETFAQIVGTADDPEDKDGVRICCSEDAAYIAAANPATVLQLLDMVERLEREADWLADNLTANCNSKEECYTFCPDLLKRWGCHAVTVSDWRKAARNGVEKLG